MATKKTQFGSVKRFGTRYGSTNKRKLATIEKTQKKPTTCPECHYEKVSRISNGIWTCSKCGNKFTSRAYEVTKLPKLQSETSKQGV